MLNFGFYDSVDGDRTYNAESMSRLFDGIIRDGVFGTVGDHFALSLSPRGGLRVRVGSGRAWFNGTWTDLRPANSDDNLEFELTYNSSGSTRYDHIVLVVDKRATSRKNEIKVFEGSWPNDSTQWPTNVYYYRLGYVDVGSGVTALTYASIHTRVGFDNPDAGGVPFVTGPLETISIDDLVDEWEAEINDKIDAAIEEYFDGGAGIEFASVPADIGNGFTQCLSSGIAKSVSISGYKQVQGGRVSIFFLYDVPANATLSINSGAAKPIYHGGYSSPIADGVIKGGMTATFVYDNSSGGRFYLTALDRNSVENIQFVHVSQNGSSFSTDTNADVIRAVLQNDPDVLVLMIDPDGRQGTMIETPLNIGDSMKFAIVTDDGTMVYTITSGGTVSRTIDDNVYNIDNVVFVPFMATGSGFEAQLTPEIIYNENVRDGKNILFCLVDPVTHFIAPLQNMLTSTSDIPIFRAVDTLNQQFVNYALSATGGVTWTTTSFGGSGGGSWDDIKPANGVPASDLANDAKPFKGYGTCTTGELVMAKNVTVSGYELLAGGLVVIKFNYRVIAGSTLNIHSGTTYTGDKPIKRNGANAEIPAGSTVLLEYDGTNYNVLSNDTFADAEVYWANISRTYVTDHYEYSCDKTFTQLLDALANGKLLIVRYDYKYYLYSNYSDSGATEHIDFRRELYNSWESFGVDEEDDVTYFTGTYSNVFDITFSIVNSNPACNRLFSDIVAAKASEKILRPIFDDFEGIVSHIDTIEAQFWFIDDTGGSPTWYVFTIDDTNAVTVGTTIMGDAMNPTVFTDSSATPSSLMAQANYIYKFTAAALTSLTGTVVPANGDTCIEFNSGSTPTTLTISASAAHMPDDFVAPEANKHYEISFHNGYALVASWGITS